MRGLPLTLRRLLWLVGLWSISVLAVAGLSFLIRMALVP
ncbi:MAG: DUF2474 family protein [Gammaproteobacteria bacterium]|nr:DUF2474 family protein [Gammaproteobacteria bacterium]